MQIAILVVQISSYISLISHEICVAEVSKKFTIDAYQVSIKCWSKDYFIDSSKSSQFLNCMMRPISRGRVPKPRLGKYERKKWNLDYALSTDSNLENRVLMDSWCNEIVSTRQNFKGKKGFLHIHMLHFINGSNSTLDSGF